LIAEKSVNNQFFGNTIFKGILEIVVIRKKSITGDHQAPSHAAISLQKWALRPYKDFFKRKLLMNLVVNIGLLNKLLVTVTPLFILGTEFIGIFAFG